MFWTCFHQRVRLSQAREPDAEYKAAEVSNVKKTEELDVKAGEAPDETVADFYSLFVGELARLAVEPISAEELAEKLGLHKSQVADWLKRSLNDGCLKKLSSPVRYQYIKNNAKE